MMSSDVIPKNANAFLEFLYCYCRECPFPSTSTAQCSLTLYRARERELSISLERVVERVTLNLYRTVLRTMPCIGGRAERCRGGG